MSKKQLTCTLEPCCGHRAAKRSKQQKKYLYLIVDNWERGYSVYKVDVDAFDAGADAEPLPLPEPPVVRFEAQHGGSWYFAAHGTRILAMQPSGCPAFPVFDVEAGALTVCPWPYPGGNSDLRRPFFASVASSLYLLRASRFVELPGVDPPLPDSGDDVVWSWAPVAALPFDDSTRISASAHHPDGRTLIVSQDGRTFAFDATRRSWALRGTWILPFVGEAFFDGELDAWVGLCHHKGGVGYVCACEVPAVAADRWSLPAWKLSEDPLFDADSKRHLGAKLLFMGDGKYCLIESLARDDEEVLRRLHKDGYYPHDRVLAVTTFSLKYDRQGKLIITKRKVQSYEVTDAHQFPEPSWKPVGFWM